MFGDLMAEMNAAQQEMEKKINAIQLSHSIQEGAIRVSLNGKSQITSLDIDPEKVDLNDAEQLEDLLIIVLNEALARLEQEKVEVTNDSMKDILPPGLDGLF